MTADPEEPGSLSAPSPTKMQSPWRNVPNEKWNDWRWQMSHRLNTLEELQKVINLTPDEIAGVTAPDRFRLDITPYFASLMDRDDPNCPIRRQIIPTADRAKATVKVKVKILNPGEHMLPEMSATVSFLQAARTQAELREPPRIWLPTTAIVDGRVATVDANNRVIWKRVTTGANRENRLEIVGGLREGERVVTDKADALKAGQLVRLNET